jgi:hypothetical protein
MNKTILTLGLLWILFPTRVFADTYQAGPSDYQTVAATLQPGDILVLDAGDYPDGLDLRLHGRSDAWITIKGPDTGPQPRFLAKPSACCNVIEIREGSYLAFENLTVDGQNIDGPFGFNAGSPGPTHHIRIENCTLVGFGAHQQDVGISTKVATWGWVIRRNRISGAGTGMYLGNSDGRLPFVGGLIEYNFFDDSKGYNFQIKHQIDRPAVSGMPTTPQKTIIRHNVFMKGTLPNESGPRPNLLLGHFPSAGNGSEDFYEVYGNFFFGNPRESLIQSEGRVVIHDNIFVNCPWSAVYLADHNATLDIAYVYNNTFYSVERGIRFGSAARVDHQVVGNLIFGNDGVVGQVTNAVDNVFDSTANADQYVNNPSLVLGQMDFHPLSGQAQGAPLDLSGFTSHEDFDLDFNGASKGARTFRGAYAGEGTNPGWQLDAEIKPEAAPTGDTVPPTGSVSIQGGATTTDQFEVDLAVSATDSGSGMGPGALMRFSNDGVAWSSAESYASTRADWDLTAFGGSSDPGMKTIWARFRDVAGNWSTQAITTTIELEAGAGPAPSAGGGGCALVPGGGSSGGFVATALLFVTLCFRRRRLLA